MKNKFKITFAVICAIICLFTFTSCNNTALNGKSTLLGSPKKAERVDFAELNTEGYLSFKNSVESFASDFAACAYADYGQTDNFAVSPVSVYMALALASQCAEGDTRQEILNALNVTNGQLKTHFATLYNSLAVERKADGVVTGLLDLSNSIWINEGANVKKDCIQSLSDDFYAYLYSAPFATDNINANKAVQDFVKKQTRGLIDKEFNLSMNTLFALINTLYLKTIWNTSGNELPYASGKYDFAAYDGTVTSTQLLQGDYVSGRAAHFDAFDTFYTATADGYKIKFIVPCGGFTVDQVFTAQNLALVNGLKDYGGIDDETDTHYFTRVLFPEYKCKYDKNIKDLLKDNFGINSLFSGLRCDFTALTDNECYCSSICHVTDLTVDKNGIEGAAVTVLAVTEAYPGTPVKNVREDFVIDKAFGFIITGSNDVTLFSGVVNGI